MIYFNLPGLYEHIDFYCFLKKFREQNPEAFYEDVEVGSVFGNFHFCPWDGGRNFMYYRQASLEDMLSAKRMYNDFKWPCRFIFTNPEIKKEHLDNRFCNLILQTFADGPNEVCVNSSLMEDYIRTNYPTYKIVSSTTKRLSSPNKALEELNKDYYQVCLDYDLNKNKEFLSKIPKENIEKVEMLVNAICPPHCPIRKEHYSFTGKAQLTWLKETYQIPQCQIKETSVHPTTFATGNNLTNEEIRECYNNYGINRFKLEGRTLPTPDVLIMIGYYMIKPEYFYYYISEAAKFEGIFVNANNNPFVYLNRREKKFFDVDPPTDV